ncbi:hypothetical protein P879_05350 [Paragonimus westermani]|uniref:Neuropeptide-Like Protein n=1 Tax=Paragonimus westermani TaxID=34504 RepID=A0A8T0DBP3_9TREM|nr:hypothetical protein P879_05350 [Paragonimus westermani]
MARIVLISLLLVTLASCYAQGIYSSPAYDPDPYEELGYMNDPLIKRAQFLRLGKRAQFLRLGKRSSHPKWSPTE